MKLPPVSLLYEVTNATWPAARETPCGTVTLREGQGGGSRVSAATVDGPLAAGALAEAEEAMRNMGQVPLFMVREGEAVLDSQLAEAGYVIKDPVRIYAAPVEVLMSEALRPVSTFRIWPPLQIQRDLWAEGGIGPARLQVMARAECPKTALLGRIDDAPAAAGYVGYHAGIGMLHALEVAPEHRGKSMGARMTRAAAFWAAEQGACHLALIVTQANVAGNALYRSVGMQNAGTYHYRIRPT